MVIFRSYVNVYQRVFLMAQMFHLLFYEIIAGNEFGTSG